LATSFEIKLYEREEAVGVEVTGGAPIVRTWPTKRKHYFRFMINTISVRWTMARV
jgi:hypothetical protein